MKSLCVTIDLDWASEAAIGRTIGHFDAAGIPLTIFSTHDSQRTRLALARHEVGLHPYFGHGSDHGGSVEEVVSAVLRLPHNLPAFRYHRFEGSYLTAEAMARAGMRIASNTCTDSEVVQPFRDRSGVLEIPIFLEDGGYLARSHPLEMTERLRHGLDQPGARVLVIHPMHFCANSPSFDYMRDIKSRHSRREWNMLTECDLDRFRHTGRGIQDLILEVIEQADRFTTIGRIAQEVLSTT